ncbi:dipeptidyl peptidase 3-like isoform X1 [Branchiostoma lanceolatum]|uniref:dipeptidyl peptidase 3-like isoform X1 n=1 Tax=Branchiostoma lanceolatum TaxID=7740 RepID=UPI0034520C68
MSDQSQYVLPTDSPVALLDCKAAFGLLTDREKLYAHYLSQASWYGGLIVLLQTSPESPGIFVLLQKLFQAQSPKQLEQAATAAPDGPSEEEFQALMVYAAGFYSNMGNYKSFGDTKFIPGLPVEKFKAAVWSSAAYTADPAGTEKLWTAVSGPLYSLTNREKQLGLGDKGITTYFSQNCGLKDAEIAQKFLDEQKISPYNTRLFKTKEGYEVRLASSATSDSPVEGMKDDVQFPSGQIDGANFTVKRGDYAPLMEKVVHNLKLAKSNAANPSEEKMLTEYARSFTIGSIDAHKDGSRHWIQDKGPIVESYIGFIESYRDPFGVRGEFEGFVAMVNKQMSAKFASLVGAAEDLLPLLPWPAEYEKDRFLRPDFTSLDILTFGGSGIPAGINIPNYDDIRQSEGFKNVSLGNVLNAQYASDSPDKVTFLGPKDREIFMKYKVPSFEVQVGLHELLGHGSGKLFKKEADGTFNFDTENVKHTETGEKISSWYQAGETWDSKFPVISSSYEECRAECVGIYLSPNPQVLKIFGHEGQEAEDIMYINWLNMVRAGVVALEFYTPQTVAWRQAHMWARFVILQVLLEAREDFVTVTQTQGQDGKPDIMITMDRSKILTVGKPAIGAFLRKLQVYKSTADYPSAKAMYDKYSLVSEEGSHKWLTLRDVVLARKQPRKMFVQVNTTVKDNKVDMQEYEATTAGLIQSFADRFPKEAGVEKIVAELWEKDRPYFS